MKFLFSTNWVLFASLWYFGNGLLHDIFVIRGHKGGYDRELLRLLTDGHLLMLSGSIVFIAYLLMQKGIQHGATISIVIASFMLLYCAMIFPFLKSIGTILVSIWLIVVSARMYS